MDLILIGRWIVVAVALLAVAALLYYFLGSFSGSSGAAEHSSSPGSETESESGTAGPAAREFAGVAPQFEGLYEGLYRTYMGDLASEKSLRILHGWETRIQNADAPALLAEWSYVITRATGAAWLGEPSEIDPEIAGEIAQEWYALLTAWGVSRDSRQELRVDARVRDLYALTGNPSDGDRVEVALPCWTCGRQVAEKGLAHRMS